MTGKILCKNVTEIKKTGTFPTLLRIHNITDCAIHYDTDYHSRALIINLNDKFRQSRHPPARFYGIKKLNKWPKEFTPRKTRRTKEKSFNWRKKIEKWIYRICHIIEIE